MDIDAMHKRVADAPSSPIVTVLGYRSATARTDEAGPAASMREAGHLAQPTPADYRARCLAVGIGLEGGLMIDALVAAPWFAHLRGTAFVHQRCCPQRRHVLMKQFETWGLHLASISLPQSPTPAEINLAGELGRVLRWHRAFVVMTGAADLAGMAQLGEACDCYVTGAGSSAHHHYPVRTVSEPATGRLICHDLHDVMCLWAGRLGDYGTLRPTADALHVEVSAGVETLLEVDALAESFADLLRDREKLRLLSVVEGITPSLAMPISFGAVADVVESAGGVVSGLFNEP